MEAKCCKSCNSKNLKLEITVPFFPVFKTDKMQIFDIFVCPECKHTTIFEREDQLEKGFME